MWSPAPKNGNRFCRNSSTTIFTPTPSGFSTPLMRHTGHRWYGRSHSCVGADIENDHRCQNAGGDEAGIVTLVEIAKSAIVPICMARRLRGVLGVPRLSCKQPSTRSVFQKPRCLPSFNMSTRHVNSYFYVKIGKFTSLWITRR